MNHVKNKQLQELIQKIKDLPDNSRERCKLLNKLMKQIQSPGILLSLNILIDKDLQSLARKPKKSNKASAPFKSLITQKHIQEELYAEAKVNTFYYIRDNLDKYDPEKGTVKTWVNRTLCLKFLDAFNKEYRGKKLQIKAHAVSLDAPNSESTTTLHDCLLSPAPSKKREIHRLFRELIQNDPENFLKNSLIKSKTGKRISLQEVFLMRLEDKTLEEIETESGISLKSISSYINRKKAELKIYITEHTGITSDDL
jgi:DNA-directed RNA polymerase specialized sigma24 family protein